jgi:hypothetical protein
MARLSAVAASSIRSCDYSPRCRHHHARTLSDCHSHLQDAAVGCPKGPPTTQGSRGDYLMARVTSPPDVVNDMTVTTPPRQRPAAKDETVMRSTSAGVWTSPARDQGGAVAEAVACPLGIQPSINTMTPHPDRPAVGVDAAVKLHPPVGATAAVSRP